MDEKKYRVGELSERAGVTKRTVHYYISRGLIPPSEGSGQNSYYTNDHLLRILLIKKLQDKFLPLEKIRDLIAGLDHTGVRKMLEGNAEINAKDPEFTNSTVRTPGASFGIAYRKIELAPGYDLYCSEDAHTRDIDKIELLVGYAKRLFNNE